MKTVGKKQKIIIAVSEAVVVIIAAIAVLLLIRTESYRVLKSFEMTGTSSVERI